MLLQDPLFLATFVVDHTSIKIVRWSTNISKLVNVVTTIKERSSYLQAHSFPEISLALYSRIASINGTNVT